MSAPSFTYSGNVYTAGTAGTVDFALTSTTGNPIPYLEPGHIHVYKSSNQGSTWTELTRPSQWDFVTSGTVARLVTGISAGEWVKVQRITPSNAAYVTFQASSLLTADQLNDDTLFNTYLNQELYDQGNQSAVIAAGAETAANAATTAANAATAAANTATTTANAASATAATALSTANTASTNASAAVSTANTASTNASTAVSTANTASTNATTALNTANTASTNAAAAVTTANTASTNAASAVSTANSAASNASTALSQSNTALTQSSTALSQSSTALTNSATAVSTANTANSNAAAALNAVAASVQYVLVANVAAIPGSPADGDAVEVANSTGIESFTPLANRPAGFVGDTGLSVRMQYTSSGSTWNWLNYFANDSDTRYLKKSGGTLTGALTLNADPTTNLQAATKQYVDSVANAGGLPLTGGTMTGQILGDNSTSPSTPGYAFDGDSNTGLYTTGADELALATGGSARLTIDSSGAVSIGGSATVSGQAVVVTNDARLTDTRTPTDGSVTDAKVSASAAIAGSKIQAASTSNAGAVQLTDSTSSTSTTTAATPASVKSAYDLANTANTTATTANTTANAALPKAGGAMTGDLTLNAQSDLRFADSDSSNWVAFQGPATVSSNVTWTLPSADGTANQVLSTNGSGTLSWATAAAGATDKIEEGNTSAEVIDTGSDGRFVVTTEGTERLRVDSSGRLGIGVTTPDPGGSGLHVHNASAADSSVRVTNSTTGATSGDGFAIQCKSDGTAALRQFENLALTFETNATERARIDSSGRLLLGTSTSISSAGLNGGGTPALQVVHPYQNINPAGISLSRFQASNPYGAVFTIQKSKSDTIGSHAIVASGDELGVISFDGSNGSAFNVAATVSAFVDGTPGTNDMPGRLVFSTTADSAFSPTTSLSIFNAGKIGTGTRTESPYNFTTANAANMHVDGSGFLYRSTSSERFKTSIEEIEPQYSEALLGLRSVWYRSTCPNDNPDWGWWGFIAEEVASIDPRLVQWRTTDATHDENGQEVQIQLDEPVADGVQYDRFVPHLLNLIKRQQQAIETLEAEVAALKGA